MLILQKVEGWAKRVESPACLASKAYAELYRKIYPDARAGMNLANSFEELSGAAAHLQEALEGQVYRPDQGDALEVVWDADTLALVHLAEGDFSVPVPECLLIIRKSFFVHKRKERGFAVNPEAEIRSTMRPANDCVARASQKLLRAQNELALQTHQLYEAEYPALIATPCWTCPKSECRDAMIGSTDRALSRFDGRRLGAQPFVPKVV